MKDLDGAVRLTDPGAATEVWRTMNFALSLICRGAILGEPNAISLGRSPEAVESLQRAFRLGDDLAHRDPLDQASRSRVANAGIMLGDILTDTDPGSALAVYDHTLQHVAEIPNNSSFRRFEVSVLAGSTYALRKLKRTNEAKRRLDAAFQHLRELKLYPGEKFTLGSEVEESLRAQADYEAGTGNLSIAVRLYRNLLQDVQPAMAGPEASLSDAVRQSIIFRRAAAVERLAGQADAAGLLERRDREMWMHWDRVLPSNAFVRSRLAR